ncbi:mercuric transport protein [Pandoraea terrae]|uniref:Mercuric transport protein MerT n=1 Tax=Pandoraea terrae TaxID=1537710 RepID=A0A5E4V1U5_9BURK|nr:mercuric transporter MerT family protein [Pandoraea terrae]VVE06252.1 mercuric transport protein [Pandoraea terrae]
MSRRRTATGTLLTGAAAAIGASACCAGPLLLVVLGLGGTWGARLTALQPLQPLFVAASLTSFVLAFHRLYARPANCAPGEACSVSPVRRRQRIIFWVIAVPASALMAFPLYAPLFY